MPEAATNPSVSSCEIASLIAPGGRFAKFVGVFLGIILRVNIVRGGQGSSTNCLEGSQVGQSIAGENSLSYAICFAAALRYR